MQGPDFPEEYLSFVRPKVGNLLKLLKLDQVYDSASGDFLFYRDENAQERKVLDLLGGYGSTLFGHHHPLLVSELQFAIAEKIPVHGQLSIRKEAALLAQELNDCLLQSESALGLPVRSEKYICTFANSGAEAVEAAIKHALMQWNGKKENLRLWVERQKIRRGIAEFEDAVSKIRASRPVLIAVEGSFHGKTAASVAATWNESFRAMYPSSALEILFIKRDASVDEIRAVFQDLNLKIARGQEKSLSRICGVIYEPIQCEGGIQPLRIELLRALREQTRQAGIPMIADEIQTGLWRTGRFLASHGMGIAPDYVLLGKSLGGGLVKISALMIPEDMYQEDFGYVHTSTFAEDDLSSRVARRTLEIAQESLGEISKSADAFERLVKSRVSEIQTRYPGVIREARGRGFLVGIEFDFSPESSAPDFLRAVDETGFASYLIASFFLNRHAIRIGVTLSQRDTIRVEPSSLIEETQTHRFCDALEELCGLIFERKLLALTEHFWRCEIGTEQLDFASPLRRNVVSEKGLPVVTFLSHVIDTDHLCKMEPFFALLPESERRRFLEKFGPVSRPICYHEQIVEGTNGKRVHAKFFGVFLGSEFFEASLRRDAKGFEKVEEMFGMSLDVSATHVGLGQFTSIVSENGLLLRNTAGETKTHITTGNSLTAGFAYQALLRALVRRGKKLSELRVGIVGATGNICNVLAQLIGDHAQALTLVHRESLAESSKFREAVEKIISNSAIDPAQVRATHDPALLADCDAVILGTNSTQKILKPEFLKAGAIVLDLSVPANIDPRVALERPDVECFQGGLAALPLNQMIDSPWIPTPKGDTFACIAETLTTALLEYDGDFSLGAITKEKVLQSLQMAEQVGIELGSLRPLYRYPSSLSVSPAMASTTSY